MLDPTEPIYTPKDKKEAQEEAEGYRKKGEYARVIEVKEDIDWEAIHGGDRKAKPGGPRKHTVQKKAKKLRKAGEYARVTKVRRKDWEALHGGKRKIGLKKLTKKELTRLEKLEVEGRKALSQLKGLKREDVKFGKPSPGKVSVEVDLKKVDKYWVREHRRYVPGDCSDEQGWKCWRFLKWLRDHPDLTVRLPQVHILDPKSLDFGDGRHRTRVFMMLGFKSIPMSTEKVDEEEIRALVGTKPPKKTLKQIVEVEKEEVERYEELGPSLSIYPRPGYVDFQDWLKKELLEFEKIPGQGRLIPIRKVRAKCKDETFRKKFDFWLLKMERDFLVSLQTHNSPYMLSQKEKADSISHERGLIYYVAGRPEWLGERYEDISPVQSVAEPSRHYHEIPPVISKSYKPISTIKRSMEIEAAIKGSKYLREMEYRIFKEMEKKLNKKDFDGVITLSIDYHDEDQREIIKGLGYKWKSLDKIWTKGIYQKDFNKEVNKLMGMGFVWGSFMNPKRAYAYFRKINWHKYPTPINLHGYGEDEDLSGIVKDRPFTLTPIKREDHTNIFFFHVEES